MVRAVRSLEWLLWPFAGILWHQSMESWNRQTHTLQGYPKKKASRIFFSLSFAKNSWDLLLSECKTRLEHPQTHLFIHLFINNSITGESWLCLDWGLSYWASRAVVERIIQIQWGEPWNGPWIKKPLESSVWNCWEGDLIERFAGGLCWHPARTPWAPKSKRA